MNIDWMPGAIGAFVKKEGGRVLQVLTATRDDNCVFIGNPGFVGQRADGGGDYHVFSEHWHWVPRAVEWNGEGLPPVGTVCEWLECKQTGWQVVEVAGYYKNAAWIVPEGKEPLTVFNPANFRPIRTPEQISAEERETTVQQMIQDIGASDTDGWDHLRCAALYDAGYRKQVTP